MSPLIIMGDFNYPEIDWKTGIRKVKVDQCQFQQYKQGSLPNTTQSETRQAQKWTNTNSR